MGFLVLVKTDNTAYQALVLVWLGCGKIQLKINNRKVVATIPAAKAQRIQLKLFICVVEAYFTIVLVIFSPHLNVGGHFLSTELIYLSFLKSDKGQVEVAQKGKM